MNKKLRKLLRHPIQFFADAVDNRMATSGLLRTRPASRVSGKYSIVVLLDPTTIRIKALLASLLRQGLPIKKAGEVLFIDSGASDDVGALAKQFVQSGAVRSRYIRREADDVRSARAYGLSHASCEWVTFVDGNDLLHSQYLKTVDQFVRQTPLTKRPVALMCNVHVLNDQTGKASNSFPNRQIVQKGARSLVLGSLKNELIPFSGSIFFDRLALVRAVSDWPDSLGDAFEHRWLLATFTLGCGAADTIALLPQAVYLRRQRISVQEQAGAQFDFAAAVLALRQASTLLGCLRQSKLETWVQRQVLEFVLSHCLKPLVDRDELFVAAPEHHVAEFKDELARIGKQLPVPVLRGFPAGGQTEMHLIGFSSVFANSRMAPRAAHVRRGDAQKNLIEVRYFSADDTELDRIVSGAPDVVPLYGKTMHHSFLGQPFCYERIHWVPARERKAPLSVLVDEKPIPVAVAGKIHKAGIAAAAALELVSKKAGADTQLGLNARILKTLADKPAFADKYRDAWLLLDRSDKADDNGEHLYRYLRENRPDINAWFIVERGVEFDRLQTDGFRLIPFGSIAHKIALLHAKVVTSSHAASFAYNFLGAKEFGSLISYKFIFLQHGVTLGDLSRHFNGKPIDLIVSCSPSEHATFIDDGTYDLTSKQVALCGFPRHDVLLKKAAKPRERKTILVAPTWRRYLVSPVVGRSSQRVAIDGFFESDYAKHWFGLLRSPEFVELASRHEYEVTFFLHPAMEPYRAELQRMFSGIHFHDPNETPYRSIQDLFAEADVMLTDYSSVAFEMGLIEKSVLYYQFDAFDFLESGAHTTVKGYFEFERDGFGPVCYTQDGLLETLAVMLRRQGAPEPEYVRRMAETFVHRDGRNCVRVVDAIEGLWRTDRGDMPRNLVRMARQATLTNNWPLANQRWTQALAAGGVLTAVDAVLVARVRRRLKDLQGAMAVLEACSGEEQSSIDMRIELAELATAGKDWNLAVLRWSQLRSLCSTDETVNKVSLGLAQALRMSGDASAAVEALSHIVLDEMSSKDFLLERARCLNLVDDPREASMAWEEVLKHCGKSAEEEALLGQARCFRTLGYSAQAGAVVKKLLTLKPKHVAGRHLSGLLAHDAGRHSQVVAFWSDLLQTAPRSLTVHDRVLFAQALRLTGKAGQALKVIKPIATRSASSPRARMEYVETLFAEKKWPMLLSACRDTHELSFLGEPQRLCYLHAMAARHQSQLHEALAMIEQVLKVDARLIPARLEKAEILAAMGDEKAAAMEWSELHRLHRAEVPTDVFKRLADHLFRERKTDALHRAVQHEVSWNQHRAAVRNPQKNEDMLEYAQSLLEISGIGKERQIVLNRPYQGDRASALIDGGIVIPLQKTDRLPQELT